MRLDVAFKDEIADFHQTCMIPCTPLYQISQYVTTDNKIDVRYIRWHIQLAILRTFYKILVVITIITFPTKMADIHPIITLGDSRNASASDNPFYLLTALETAFVRPFIRKKKHIITPQSTYYNRGIDTHQTTLKYKCAPFLIT